MNMSKNSSYELDRSEISLPILTITERAASQLSLILQNDFTLKDKSLRIHISGKECDGFTYSVGFTKKESDDFTVAFQNNLQDLKVLMDPFSAHYIPEATLDFIQDFSKDAEGFVVNNLYQEKHHGKFWNVDPEKMPPLRKN